jgi:hypothetical protein
MIHIFEHLNRIEHNLMARHALHIRHKTDTAAILLIGGIVKTLLFGKPELWFVAHLYQNSFLAQLAQRKRPVTIAMNGVLRKIFFRLDFPCEFSVNRL